MPAASPSLNFSPRKGGSVFSRRAGRFWAPVLRSLSVRIGITVGPAVRPKELTPELLRERVLALCARA